MEYRIIGEKIHIDPNGSGTAAFEFWPEELITLVEAQEAGNVDAVVPSFAAILSEILEAHPEIFTCHYNADVIT
jgi:hypothetical protein